MVSNVLKFLLQKCEKPTLGVLLGLLLGAVVGLWPFQHGVPPEPGTILKGQRVIQGKGDLYYEWSKETIEPDDYPTEVFTPTVVQAGSSVGLIVVGFFVTLLVDKVGGGKSSSKKTEKNTEPDEDNRAI